MRKKTKERAYNKYGGIPMFESITKSIQREQTRERKRERTKERVKKRERENKQERNNGAYRKQTKNREDK